MSTTTVDKLIIKGLTEETTAKPILVFNPVTKRVSWQTNPNARIAALEAKFDPDNNFKFIPDPANTYNAGTRVLTMSAGWIGTIVGVDYTNENPVVLPAIPLATTGYTRIDLIVLTTDNTFVRVAGNQSTFNAIAPQLPPNTLQATFLTVTNAAVTIHNPPAPPFFPRATETISGSVKTNITVPNPVVYVKETVDYLLDGKANYFLDIKNITGITYNVILTDILHELVYGGTLPMNVIVPNNSTVPFPIGTIFYTLGTNTGIVTASGAAGVTLNVKAGISLSAIQNEVRQYTKIGVNTWSVRGDLNLGAVTQQELSYLQGTTSNIQAQLNAKAVLSGGATNYLMKWLNATTATVSRIWDNGTFLGIGTVNTPTKDWTFGNQANREIGIEESSNTTVGRDLIQRAGRTINFLNNLNFVDNLSLPANPNLGSIAINKNNNNVYFSRYVSGTYMQTAGLGVFSFIQNVDLYDISINSSNNDTYGIGVNGIYKQTAGTGSFVLQSTTGLPAFGNSPWGTNSIFVNSSNNDVWVALRSTFGGVYKQTGGSGDFVLYPGVPALGDGVRIRINPLNNDIFIGNGGGNSSINNIYKQTAGTGSFVNIYSGNASDVQINPLNGDVWTISFSGLYKQTASIGSFIFQASISSVYTITMGLDAFGNILAANQATNKFSQLLTYAPGLPNLDGGTLVSKAGTGKGTGKSRIQWYTGQKQPSGTDMQPETLRLEINEEGLVTLPNTTNEVIDADPTGKAVVTKDWIQSQMSTAFVAKTYEAIKVVAHNPKSPNFEIHLTGNINLTLTDTLSGDSGLVNIYFPANEVAIINGTKSLKLVGAGEMISIYFLHDTDGLKWDRVEKTTIHHLAVATIAGTFSNVGNVCTGTGTAIKAEMIGAKIIKANGEIGIIATRTSDTAFTTEVAFPTDSVDTAFQVKCLAYKVNADGSADSFDFNGNLVSKINIYGGLDMLGLQLRPNLNIYSYGYEFGHGDLKLYNDGNLITALPFYANDAAAAADVDLISGMGYRITGSTVFHIKP